MTLSKQRHTLPATLLPPLLTSACPSGGRAWPPPCGCRCCGSGPPAAHTHSSAGARAAESRWSGRLAHGCLAGYLEHRLPASLEPAAHQPQNLPKHPGMYTLSNPHLRLHVHAANGQQRAQLRPAICGGGSRGQIADQCECGICTLCTLKPLLGMVWSPIHLRFSASASAPPTLEAPLCRALPLPPPCPAQPAHLL